MISLSSNAACLLYLALTLTILFFLWLKELFSKDKKKLELLEKELSLCEFCHFAFLSLKGKKIVKCPQCHCFHEKKGN